MELPKIVQKKPYFMDVTPGTYAFCTCGLSVKDPYCDGSHYGTEFKPHIVTIEEQQKVFWCGCKHSKHGAFCDGEHKKL